MDAMHLNPIVRSLCSATFTYLDVCHSVVVQIGAGRKALPTHLALVRFLSGMDPSMGVQWTWRAEPFAAHRAHVRLFTCDQIKKKMQKQLNNAFTLVNKTKGMLRFTWVAKYCFHFHPSNLWLINVIKDLLRVCGLTCVYSKMPLQQTRPIKGLATDVTG